MALKTLGMRHVALNVRDPQLSKKFYLEVMKMNLEWEPDVDNVYLATPAQEGGAQDNLAIHRAKDVASSGDGKPLVAQALDHIGFFVSTPEEVDEWYIHVKANGAKILREVKVHRDGAKSFYFEDPDGIIIQLLCHSPIAKRG